MTQYPTSHQGQLQRKNQDENLILEARHRRLLQQQKLTNPSKIFFLPLPFHMLCASQLVRIAHYSKCPIVLKSDSWRIVPQKCSSLDHLGVGHDKCKEGEFGASIKRLLEVLFWSLPYEVGGWLP